MCPQLPSRSGGPLAGGLGTPALTWLLPHVSVSRLPLVIKTQWSWVRARPTPGDLVSVATLFAGDRLAPPLPVSLEAQPLLSASPRFAAGEAAAQASLALGALCDLPRSFRQPAPRGGPPEPLLPEPSSLPGLSAGVC